MDTCGWAGVSWPAPRRAATSPRAVIVGEFSAVVSAILEHPFDERCDVAPRIEKRSREGAEVAAGFEIRKTCTRVQIATYPDTKSNLQSGSEIRSVRSLRQTDSTIKLGKKREKQK
jgi:hypothetical protein